MCLFREKQRILNAQVPPGGRRPARRRTLPAFRCPRSSQGLATESPPIQSAASFVLPPRHLATVRQPSPLTSSLVGVTRRHAAVTRPRAIDCSPPKPPAFPLASLHRRGAPPPHSRSPRAIYRYLSLPHCCAPPAQLDITSTSPRHHAGITPASTRHPRRLEGAAPVSVAPRSRPSRPRAYRRHLPLLRRSDCQASLRNERNQ